MNTSAEHPLVTSYLTEFDVASADLPAARRVELREEIAGHLHEAIPVALSTADAAGVIAAFGSPAEILGQELPLQQGGSASKRRRVGRPVALIAVAVAAAIVVTTVLSLWLFAADPAGDGATGAATPKAPTSVVNKNPRGPVRIQEGTGYYEYLAAIEEMPDPLPAGAAYPEGVQAGLDSGTGSTGVMESGAGRNVAHFTWLCAWEAEYLTAVADEDAKRQVAAEEMLTKWPSFGYVVDSEAGWSQNVLEPMSFGDSSGVERDFPQTCSQAGIVNVSAR